MAFYFAWVEAADDTFLNAYEREDEEVLSFEISHQEGDFASLRIDVRNPRIGLLAVGRKRWAWLAHDDGATTTPLFFGRLVGLPQEMRADVVSLSFIAKPLNYQTAKQAVADTMKATEYYDPLFIQAERLLEPDTVLEARPMVWAVDRVTHAVTASHIALGEAGTISFGGDAFYDSVTCGYSSAPQRKVTIEAAVDWNQYGYGNIRVNFNRIDSYTGDGLLSDWPKTGANVGGGWTVKNSFAKDIWLDENTETIDQDDGSQYTLYRWWITGWVDFTYEAKRQITETATFTLSSGVQEIVTEEGDEETIAISVTGKADDPVDAGGALPIGDVRRRAYFTTARGQQSVAYLANIAAARLMASARCVDVAFVVPFSYAGSLTLRHNGSITDPRLPGGVAVGKIKAYTIYASGDSGDMGCSVTLGCTPGNGGTITTTTGTPVYVATDYVTGYQAYTGGTTGVVFDAGGLPIVTVENYDNTVPGDDGLDLFDMTTRNCLISKTVTNEADEQVLFLFGTVEDANTGLTENPTTVEVELTPVNGGPYETNYTITCSPLVVPKTIDLEAAA